MGRTLFSLTIFQFNKAVLSFVVSVFNTGEIS